MHYVMSARELFEAKVNSRKDIVEYLEDGYVKFVYFKADGERRTAFGTLKRDFIDNNFEYSDAPDNDPSRNSQKATDEMGYIKYYDLVKHGFRMFKIDNNVYFKEFYQTLADMVKAYPKLKNELSKYDIPSDEKKPKEDDGDTKEEAEDDEKKS